MKRVELVTPKGEVLFESERITREWGPGVVVPGSWNILTDAYVAALNLTIREKPEPVTFETVVNIYGWCTSFQFPGDAQGRLTKFGQDRKVRVTVEPL